jgi:hypothetical protein
MSNLYEADYEIIFKGKARVSADDTNTVSELICILDESVEMLSREPYLVTAKNIRKIKTAS